MNAGMVLTVWFTYSKNAVGIATKKTATIGSTKVLPGEIRPISMPPRNQTGIEMRMPAEPSKSNAGTTIGRPITSAAVITDMIAIETPNQSKLKPSCWKRRSSSSWRVSERFRSSIFAPHDTQRLLASGGVFEKPHDGQMILLATAIFTPNSTPAKVHRRRRNVCRQLAETDTYMGPARKNPSCVASWPANAAADSARLARLYGVFAGRARSPTRLSRWRQGTNRALGCRTTKTALDAPLSLHERAAPHPRRIGSGSRPRGAARSASALAPRDACGAFTLCSRLARAGLRAAR